MKRLGVAALLARAYLNNKWEGVAYRAIAAACIALAIFATPVAGYAAEKITTPVIEKTVLQVHADGSSSWQRVADVSAGEPAMFRLVGTLPSNWEEFKFYRYEFIDTADAALAVDASSVTVELIDRDGAVKQDLTDAFTVEAPDAVGSAWSASIADLKAVAASAVRTDKLVLTYKAALDSERVAAGVQNAYTNVAYLEYTSKPFTTAIGRSVEAEAQVVTWGMRLTKVDEDKQDTVLANAAFTIQAVDGCYLAADGSHATDPHEFISDKTGKVSVTGLASGIYTVTETRAPKGYAKYAKPFHVVIESSLDQDDPGLTVTVKESNASAQADPQAGVAALRVPNAREKGTAVLPSIIGMPQTGDRTFYAIVLVVGLGVACLAIAKTMRRNKNNEQAE